VVQLLSNGSYHVMVTGSGGGYSRWKNLAVTRWIEDSTRDNWGSFVYIADVASGQIWSSGHQPVLRPADRYDAVFSPGRAKFSRRDGGFETVTDIVVAPGDDVELRRIRITNISSASQTLEVTSYAEVVLAPPATDTAHPAFSNLFVETEVLRESGAIVCARRPASTGESTPWMFHLLALRHADPGELSYETDRMRFIGRGRNAASPQALDDRSVLSGSAGPVLDPVAAIRSTVTLAAGATALIDLVTGAGGSRDACVDLIAKYRDVNNADHVLAGAADQAQAMLDTLHVDPPAAQLYASLARFVVYANASLRAVPDVLARNSLGQPSLWAYAISGDLPIVLLQIADPGNIELARQLIDAHAFWRLHGLAVDLLIRCAGSDAISRALYDQITQLISARGDTEHLDLPGGIYVRLADSIPEPDRILMETVARIVLDDKDGSLAEQIKLGCAPPPAAAADRPSDWPSVRVKRPPIEVAARSATTNLSGEHDLGFWNGLGGFSPDGREYVITLRPGQPTPVPWINVLANPTFGTLVSESGSATTWSENAQEFRLTPWSTTPWATRIPRPITFVTKAAVLSGRLPGCLRAAPAHIRPGMASGTACSSIAKTVSTPS
jgi:cellobiose phosphorylase